MMLDVFLYCSPLCFLREGLSLNPELSYLVRLTGQQVPGILMSPLPQAHTPVFCLFCFCFLCLYGNHFMNNHLPNPAHLSLKWGDPQCARHCKINECNPESTDGCWTHSHHSTLVLLSFTSAFPSGMVLMRLETEQNSGLSSPDIQLWFPEYSLYWPSSSLGTLAKCPMGYL